MLTYISFRVQHLVSCIVFIAKLQQWLYSTIVRLTLASCVSATSQLTETNDGQARRCNRHCDRHAMKNEKKLLTEKFVHKSVTCIILEVEH